MINDFEKQLVEIMISESCTFNQALKIVFDVHEVDTTSVFDLVDFLEDRVEDLNTVGYYMNIWTGRENDLILKETSPKGDER